MIAGHGKQRLMIEMYVLPAFKNIYLDSVSLYAVESWYRKLLEDGLSRRYAHHIGECFKRMMSRAEGAFLTASPIRKLKLLTPERHIPATLNREEVRHIYSQLKGRERLMFTLWIHIGLRKAEMQYLQWSDIDFDNRKLYVLGKQNIR